MTLVEALVAVMLTGIVCFAFISYFAYVQKSYNVLDSDQMICVAELQKQFNAIVPESGNEYAPISFGSRGEPYIFPESIRLIADAKKRDQEAFKQSRIKPSLIDQSYVVEMSKSEGKGNGGLFNGTSPIFKDLGVPVVYNHFLLQGSLARLVNIYHEVHEISGSEAYDICVTGVSTESLMSRYELPYSFDSIPKSLEKFKSSTRIYPIDGSMQLSEVAEIICPRPFFPVAGRKLEGKGGVFTFGGNTSPNGGFVVLLEGTYQDKAGLEKKCSFSKKFYQPMDLDIAQPEVFAKVTKTTPEGMNYQSRTPPSLFKSEFPFGFPTFSESTDSAGKLKLSVNSALDNNRSCNITKGNRSGPMTNMSSFSVEVEVGLAKASSAEPGTILLCRDTSQQLAPKWLNRQNVWTWTGGVASRIRSAKEKPVQDGDQWGFDYGQLPTNEKWLPCDQVTLCGVPIKSAEMFRDQKNPYNYGYRMKFESSDESTPGVRDAFYGCDLGLDVVALDVAGNSSRLSKKLKVRGAGEVDMSKLSNASTLEAYFQPHDAFDCKEFKRDWFKIFKLILGILRFVMHWACMAVTGGLCGMITMVEQAYAVYGMVHMIEAMATPPPANDVVEASASNVAPTSSAVPVRLLVDDGSLGPLKAAIKVVEDNDKARASCLSSTTKGPCKFAAGTLKDRVMPEYGENHVVMNVEYTLKKLDLEGKDGYKPGESGYAQLMSESKAYLDEVYAEVSNQIFWDNLNRLSNGTPCGQAKLTQCRSLSNAHFDFRQTVEKVSRIDKETIGKFGALLTHIESAQAETNLLIMDEVAREKARNSNLTSAQAIAELKAEAEQRGIDIEGLKAKGINVEKLVEDAKVAVEANKNSCAELNPTSATAQASCVNVLNDWIDRTQDLSMDFSQDPSKMNYTDEQWAGMSQSERSAAITAAVEKSNPLPTANELCPEATGGGGGAAGFTFCNYTKLVEKPPTAWEIAGETFRQFSDVMAQLNQAQNLAEAIRRGDNKAAAWGAYDLAFSKGGVFGSNGLFGAAGDKYDLRKILAQSPIINQMSKALADQMINVLPVEDLGKLVVNNFGGQMLTTAQISQNLGNAASGALVQGIMTALQTGNAGQALKSVAASLTGLNYICQYGGCGGTWKQVDQWNSCKNESHEVKKRLFGFGPKITVAKTECSKRTDMPIPHWIRSKDYPSCPVTRMNFNYPSLGAYPLLSEGKRLGAGGAIVASGPSLSIINPQSFYTTEGIINWPASATGVDFENGFIFNGQLVCSGKKDATSGAYYSFWEYASDEAGETSSMVKQLACCHDPSSGVVPNYQLTGGEIDSDLKGYFEDYCGKVSEVTAPPTKQNKVSAILTRVAYQISKDASGKPSFTEVSPVGGHCVQGFDLDKLDMVPSRRHLAQDYDFCSLSGENSGSLCRPMVFVKFAKAPARPQNCYNQGDSGEVCSDKYSYPESLAIDNANNILGGEMPLPSNSFPKHQYFKAMTVSEFNNLREDIKRVKSELDALVVPAGLSPSQQYNLEESNNIKKNQIRYNFERKVRTTYGLNLPADLRDPVQRSDDDYTIQDMWYVLKRPSDVLPAGKTFKSVKAQSDVIHVFEYRVPIAKSSPWCFSTTDIEAAEDILEGLTKYMAAPLKPICYPPPVGESNIGGGA